MKITLKKALLLTLFVLVLTALFVVGANAATYLDNNEVTDTTGAVAKVEVAGDENQYYYTALGGANGAIAKANTATGGKITLLSDNVPLNESTTLVGNITIKSVSKTERYTITADFGDAAGKLFTSASSSGKELTFENVIVDVSGTNAETYIFSGGAKITVKNSHLKCSKQVIRIDNGDGSATVQDGSVIEGGTIGLGNWSGGTRTYIVTDSQVIGGGVALNINNGTNTITITNSIIKSTGTYAINVNAGNNKLTITTDTTMGYTIKKSIVESSADQTININHSTNGCVIKIENSEIKNTSQTNHHALHVAGYSTYTCKPNITIDNSTLSSDVGSALRFAKNTYISATITIQNNSVLRSPLEPIFLGITGTHTVTIDNSTIEATVDRFPISTSAIKTDFILKGNAQIIAKNSNKAISFGNADTVRNFTFENYTGSKLMASTQALTQAAVCQIYLFGDLAVALTNANNAPYITLFDDLTLSETLAINKSVTIDGRETHTITSTAATAFEVSGEIKVVFSDLTLDATNKTAFNFAADENAATEVELNEGVTLTATTPHTGLVEDVDVYTNLGSIPMAAFNGTNYLTLKEAIDEAIKAGGGTITLLRDAELNADAQINLGSAKITINGLKDTNKRYTITTKVCGGASLFFANDVNAGLTLQNVNAVMTDSANNKEFFNGVAQISIENCDLEAHVVLNVSGTVKVTITNSTLLSKTYRPIQQWSAGAPVIEINKSVITSKADVAIYLNNPTGTNIDGDKYAFLKILNGSTVTAKKHAIQYNQRDAKIEITDSKVTSTDEYGIYVEGSSADTKPDITIDKSTVSGSSAIRFYNNNKISATITIKNNSIISGKMETIFLGASGTNNLTIDSSIVETSSTQHKPITTNCVNIVVTLKGSAKIEGTVAEAISLGNADTVRTVKFENYTGADFIACTGALTGTGTVNLYLCDDIATAKTKAGDNGVVLTCDADTAAAIRAEYYIVTLADGVYTIGAQFDTTDMNQKLAAAESAMNGVTVNTIACQAGLGNKYVLSQDVLNALTTAITAAKNARDKDYIDQNALNAAATALQNAIDEFNPQVKVGTDHVDEGKDHVCDNGCGVSVDKHEDSDFDDDHVCDYCGQEDDNFAPHVDENKDHTCDNGCNEPIGPCEDNDHDHYCDYGGAYECGEYFDIHEDSDNDDDHNCDYCNERMEGAVCTPNDDDGNCTTAITCSVCGDVTTAAKTHTPGADDGDCTTAVKCANAGCTQDAIAAKTHTPGADDGDCTTAVKCTNTGCTKDAIAAKAHTPGADDGDCTTAVDCTECDQVAIAAKAHTPGVDDGDCTTAVDCTECDQVAIAAKTAHTPGADDGDCTTAITCTECGTVTTAAKTAHTGGTATCKDKAKCSICNKEYGELAEHKYDNDSDATCNVCNQVREVAGSGSGSGNENNANNKGETPEKDGLSGGAIAGIVIGAVVVLGGGGFALFWFVIKKKKD